VVTCPICSWAGVKTILEAEGKKKAAKKKARAEL
jgi:hypothetical protein